MAGPWRNARFPVPLQWGVPLADDAVLAHAWGWYPAGAGKVVWFEYPGADEAP
ncbi:hypothetical protein SAMN06272789_5666 [Streptomyces sp. 1331.2]|nr:hypothetical protein SAMN06272789_5666 [Streptomyces sp. 1331.2]